MAKQVRQLAAILFTDIVGYTAMMQKDEKNAVRITKRYIDVLRELVAEYGGDILNDYGDGSLSTFTSATQAVQCALEIQQQLQEDPKVPLRIGLHVGEIFFEDGKVFGDGVNIASRIQSLGVPNSILFSAEINSKLKNQQDLNTVSLGRFHFKNVDEQVEVFALSNPGLAVPDRKKMEGKLQGKRQPERKLIIAALLIILATAAFFIYRRFSVPKGFTGEKSIAVLPFEQSGGTNMEEYMSDGISQDIINNLSKISSLQKVIGWFSVKGFRQTKKSLKDIAKELEVNIILTGSIQRNANKIKVIAELIEVASNKRLWGNDYTFDASDFLSVQSDVAMQIVAALRGNLSPTEKASLSKQYTDNVEAYRYYRIGRTFWDARTAQSFDSAEANYKKALQLDPDYALAYAGLADCYLFNQRGIIQLESVPVGREYALKALSIDSNLSEALTTRGWIEGAFDYDWAKSKGTLEKAMRLNPNYPLAHMFYGNLLQYTGENAEKGISEVRKALALDPLSISINWVLGRNYYLNRQPELAYDQIKKTITLDPNYFLAKETLIFLLLQRRNYTEALSVVKQLPIRSYWVNQHVQLANIYAMMGDTIRGNQEIETYLKEIPNSSPFTLCRYYSITKNYPRAFAELEKAIDRKDIWIYNYLKLDPLLDSLRTQPGFQHALKRANLN